MRTSCSGCRILRKGCSEDCVIRPCLDWIASPEAQANATLFLANFYTRGRLTDHLKAGPAHLRPAIFKSLLYEACGRKVDPVYGALGLLSSGQWHLCLVAVNNVLNNQPIVQMTPPSPDNDRPTRSTSRPTQNGSRKRTSQRGPISNPDQDSFIEYNDSGNQSMFSAETNMVCSIDGDGNENEMESDGTLPLFR